MFNPRSILYILFLNIILVFAKPTLQEGHIKGRVFEQGTRSPIVGANILIKNSETGTVTNSNGSFHFKALAPGNYQLIISMMGYKKKQVNVTVNQGETTNLNIPLKPTLVEMGAIVVTGTHSKQHYKDIPVKTQVVSKQSIEQRSALNLSESLEFLPSVSVDNSCQNCNFTELRILGLGNKYSQILIDGDPVISSLAGVYGLEHFPSNMISSLEIVKGGASALYGGGAVAGVVNLRTRRPSINRTSINFQTRYIGGSYDNSVSANTEMVNSKGNSGAYIYASTRNRDHYDYNGDGFSELSLLQNETMGFNWYLQPTSKTEIATHVHRIHSFRRGGNDFDKPLHEANIAESPEHWRWGGTVRWKQHINQKWNYKIFYSFSYLNRDSYYGGLGSESNPDSSAALAAYGNTENPLHIGGIRSHYKLGSHKLTAGFQYRQESLTDNAVRNPLYYLDKNFTNAGFFLQDNLQINEFDIVIGARLDKHSELDEPVISPRINAKYNLNKEMALRAGIATGFKAPKIYDEDLHICGLEGGQRVIRNADDLEEEKSITGNLNFDYIGYINDMATIFNITAYYTQINNAFTQIDIPDTKPLINLWERQNGEGAQVKGVEAEFGIRPGNKAEIRSSLTYKTTKYDNIQNVEFENATDEFLYTPDLSGNVSFYYPLFKNLNINFASKYIGKMKVLHESAGKIKSTPAFYVFDIGLLSDKNIISEIDSNIKIGIKNITNAYQDDLDKGVDRDPGYLYGPTLPRAYYLDISVSL